MPTELAAALLGPLIAAVAAAFGVWLRAAIAERDRNTRRRRALSDAAEEVAFINSWITAHDLVASGQEQARARTRALADLERAYSVLAVPVVAAPADARTPAPTTSAQGKPFQVTPTPKYDSVEASASAHPFRSLFVIGTSKAPSMNVGRVAYYVLLAWLGLSSALAMLTFALTPDIGVAISLVISVGVLGVLPVWGARAALLRWDAKLQRSERASTAHSRAPQGYAV